MNRAGFILATESYLIRKGLAATLNRIPSAVVVREFDTAPQLMEFLKKNGNEFIIVSQSIFNQVSEVFLSEDHLLERTILLMDSGSLEETDHVMAAINTDDSRDKILDILRALIDSQQNLDSGIQASGLTPRENTIVRLVTTGYTNNQIAEQLFLSAHTVITHRKNITSKLGIKSVSGLTIFAIVNNIITIEEVTSKPDQ
jgi:DNA-binding CsgD family transcriptional regulator